MKKAILLTIAVLLIFTAVSAAVKKNEKNTAKADTNTEDEINKIKKMVKASKVCGIINKDCQTFNDYIDLKATGELKKDTEVEVLRDRSLQYYLVRENENSEPEWVRCEDITIPDDTPANKQRMSTEDMEKYVNFCGFESETDYFIWVDIDRQLTNIFVSEENGWRLDRSLICSTGKNISPTTRGEFTISDRGEWFYSERLGSGAMYYTRFNGSYLFHSVAMDKDKNITDPVLGEKRSSGCVRLSVDDARYIYENIPEGTKVYIN